MSTSSLASNLSECSSSYKHANLLGSPMDLRSFSKCPRCRIQYDFLKRVNVSKVPLVLTCKHTVCEDCIKRLCLTNNTLCPVCKEEFSVQKSQLDSLTEVFTPHYALIGQLVWMKNGPIKSEQLNWVSTGYTLRSKQAGCEDLKDTDTEPLSDESDEDGEKLSLLFDKCPQHNDQYLSIKCVDCDANYCCFCFLENHTGHASVYLYKLNEEEAAKLDRLKTDVEVVLGQLLQSKKRTRDLRTFEPTQVEQDIKYYFTNLHAKLHVAERNIREKLLHLDGENGDVNSVNRILKSTIRKVKNIVDHFRLVNSNKLNVRALYEEAKQIINIPCRVVSDQGALQPIEFVANNVFDDIEQQVYVESIPTREYSLEPIEDWSEAQEKYQLEQIRNHIELPPQSRNNHSEVQRIHGEIHHKDRVLCFVPSSVSRNQKNVESNRRSNEAKIRVVVTHINSLNSFYIQKHSALDTLKEINNNIARRPKKRDRVEEFKIAGIYGVAYETKHKVYWRRGRLVDYCRKGEITEYKMFFIDYGNTHIVTRDKLKELDLHTVRRLPFSYECKLHNPSDVAFDENVHLRLPQIIEQKELYLRFVNSQTERNRVNEVELWVAASNGGLILVRDLLFKSSLSVEPKNAGVVSELRLFENSKRFTPGQEVQVVVTYIRDPDHICVQVVDNLAILKRMKDEMATYYENKPVINCIPVCDTFVVVKYYDEKQGKYHRAKITSVDVSSKEVGVNLVDWGKSTFVSWSHLRMLTEDFIKVEIQGIVVKLADVQKINPNEAWPQEAINCLQEKIPLNQEYRLAISSVEPLEAALFQTCPSGDICLNAWLVQYNHAVSMGTLSGTVIWPVNTDEPQGEDDDFVAHKLKQSEEVLMEDDDIQLHSEFFMPVKVLKCENPDLIYIKFTKFKENDEKIDKELQIHYSKKNKRKESWKVGEFCVIFDKFSMKYYRATIKSKVNAQNYLVYLYDFARDMKPHVTNIFVQEKYFLDIQCYVCKCRLSNIQPAQGTGTWSQMAVELLRKIFATHKNIYVKKVETNEEDEILGVVMWYSLTTATKALEPSKVKYISINHLLIDSGVAFYAAASSVKEEAKKVVENTSKNWFDIVCEEEKERDESESIEEEAEESFHVTSQTGWLDPPRLSKREFNATLTCVDERGYFYIRDENMQKCYLRLEEHLTEKMNATDLTTSDNWEVGDMCSIFDHEKWYRGTVLEIKSPDHISVEMIDFGSAHEVTFLNITRCLMYTDVEPMIYKVRLNNVYSKAGLLTAEDVNMLLDLVTDDVKIVIKGDKNLEVPYAEITLDDGSNLNDLVVQKCPHMTRHKPKNPQNDSNKQIRTNFDYIFRPQVSKEKEKLFVVSVLKWDVSYNVVLSNREDTTASQDFVDLSAILQIEAPEQKALENINIDALCVCIQPQKKLWARAAIYSIDTLKYNFVLVFFVDYGTMDMVSASDLKEMRDEWLEVPVYMQIASINIELLQTNQADNVLIQLNNLRGKSVWIEVVSKNPFKVHLYEDGELYYQRFVNSGIVKAL